MEKKFTEQESLAVINGMIAQARGRIERGDGKYFLLWGYVVTLASIAHFILIYYTTLPGNADKLAGINPGVVWAIASAIGVVLTVMLAIKDRHKVTVKTYADSISNAIWGGFCVGVLVIVVSVVWRNAALIYPLIGMLYVYALFMTARTFRLRWMYINVAICLVLQLAFIIGAVQSIYWPLIYAAIMITGNIVPGHILNAKGRHNV